MLQLSMDFFLGVLSNLQLWNLGQNFVSVFIYSKPFANVQLALVSQIWTILKKILYSLSKKQDRDNHKFTVILTGAFSIFCPYETACFQS